MDLKKEWEEFEDNETIRKFKSLGFWIGLIGVILVATGNDIGDFQTWSDVGNYIVSVLQSPVMLTGVVLAIYSNWNNPTKKGLN